MLGWLSRLPVILCQSWCFLLALSDLATLLCWLMSDWWSSECTPRICQPILRNQRLWEKMRSLDKKLSIYGKQLTVALAMLGRLNDLLGVNQGVERNLILQGAKAHIVFEMTSTNYSPRWYPAPHPPFEPNSALYIFQDPPILGSCWDFPGSTAHVGIRLHQKANISGFSLAYPLFEQVSPSMLAHAPRTVRLWGRRSTDQQFGCSTHTSHEKSINDFLTQRPLPNFLTKGDILYKIAEMEFDINGQRSRQFVSAPLDHQSCPSTYDFAILEVVSNWGASRTCVYQVGLHGKDS